MSEIQIYLSIIIALTAILAYKQIYIYYLKKEVNEISGKYLNLFI